MALYDGLIWRKYEVQLQWCKTAVQTTVINYIDAKLVFPEKKSRRYTCIATKSIWMYTGQVGIIIQSYFRERNTMEHIIRQWFDYSISKFE